MGLPGNRRLFADFSLDIIVETETKIYPMIPAGASYLDTTPCVTRNLNF